MMEVFCGGTTLGFIEMDFCRKILWQGFMPLFFCTFWCFSTLFYTQKLRLVFPQTAFLIILLIFFAASPTHDVQQFFKLVKLPATTPQGPVALDRSPGRNRKADRHEIQDVGVEWFFFCRKRGSKMLKTTRWWFHFFSLNFHPEIWGRLPILTHIFARGWFNHQLHNDLHWEPDSLMMLRSLRALNEKARTHQRNTSFENCRDTWETYSASLPISKNFKKSSFFSKSHE